MALFIPKDRKSLFRQFLAGMYDAVVITDPSGHVLETNPRAEEFFGRDAEETLDQPISVFIRGLSPEVVQRIRRGLEADRHMMIDANGLRKDGTSFACEVTVSVIDLIDPDDLVFTVRNVERRRKIRDMLRAKEGAFEISRSALFACDTAGVITEANAAFCEMFELKDAEEAKGHTFAEFFTDEPLAANFAKALAGESSTVTIVAETDAEGGSGEIEVTLAPNKPARKVKGVVGSVARIG